ncbi:GNAT family N-acetyltransferase [Echinicola vietnamensis]|uniref:Acetyltransferase, N-acetylglutamate synthase n=1 Tax=Echinicola vietnamensis (strain DSM 17526 / LMG 23754 / KMM 6221) TaxID=926556 RepID=L0FVN7_ECHVK|nr:GNAT family N-acetyltransferase [Echinicola vietnamensis]AGA77372.1 acetyltransferase, N-acetylglutamate synthase [Echinicola vietnamensis DSM 17526]
MNAYDIIIRQAELNDMIKVQQLYVETIQNSCKNDYSEEQIAAWISSVINEARWQQALKEEFFLVAEYDEKIVGFGALKDDNYIDFMYIQHEYQRLGLAERLLKALEHQAKKNHSAEIIADASKTAVPFFEKMGFRMVQENTKVVNGLELVNYRVEKAFLE